MGTPENQPREDLGREFGCAAVFHACDPMPDVSERMDPRCPTPVLKQTTIPTPRASHKFACLFTNTQAAHTGIGPSLRSVLMGPIVLTRGHLSVYIYHIISYHVGVRMSIVYDMCTRTRTRTHTRTEV